MKIDALPNWSFHIDEISAGFYRIGGKNNLGCNIELHGIDPDKLKEEAKTSAQKMEHDLNKK